MSASTGKISAISGSVVDVEFGTHELPKLRDELIVFSGSTPLVMEVAQHIGHGTVRCIMLASSDGLHLGDEVHATGSGICVPVGKNVLGRVFNVLGQTIDGGEPLPKNTPRQAIHRKAPDFPALPPA